MSTYNPAVPTGTINLDIDYQNIQNNFSQLNTTFSENHTAIDDQTAQNGYHTIVNLIPVSTTATNPPNNQPINGYTATAGFGQVLSANINDGINTDEALYWLTGANRLLQLTRNFVPVAANNGYTFLPGGLIIQWGVITSPTSGDNVVTFPIQFPTSCFNVQLTLQRAAANVDAAVIKTLVGPPTIAKTGFTAISPSGGSQNIYWQAIGI